MRRIPRNEWIDRVKKTKDAMEKRGLDVLLIYSNAMAPAHVFYLSGYDILMKNAVIMLPLEGEPAIFIDLDWDLERAKETSWISDIRESVNLMKDAWGFLKNQSLLKKKIGIVGIEAMPLPIYRELERRFSNRPVEFVSDLLMKIRNVKSPWEIEMMRVAANIADTGVEAALEAIEDGKTEQEIAFKAELSMKMAGAEKASSLVSSGLNTDVPVRFPSNKAIQKGDFVMMDLSPVYNHYLADIARTVVVGEPSERQMQIFSLVLEVHDKTIEAIKPGVETLFIERVARDLMKEAGYSEHFLHCVGHGIGLEGREFELDKNGFELMPGMVFTVEPGIYIRGLGGVRIEDDILVTEKGAERLTKSTISLKQDLQH